MVIVIRASGRHGLLETLIVIVIRAMSYHVLHDWPLQTDEPGANSLITLYPKNSTTFEGVNSMNVRHKSFSGDFYFPESDPPHKIMRYWFYYRRGISGGPVLKYFYMFQKERAATVANPKSFLCQRKKRRKKPAQ